MICSHGEQKTPEGQTGIFFFCNFADNKGNVCRFVKWCHLTQQYEASTDNDGKNCPNFYIEELPKFD